MQVVCKKTFKEWRLSFILSIYNYRIYSPPLFHKLTTLSISSLNGIQFANLGSNLVVLSSIYYKSFKNVLVFKSKFNLFVRWLLNIMVCISIYLYMFLFLNLTPSKNTQSSHFHTKNNT